MKKLLIIIAAAVFFTSCGQFERLYDMSNYESLTNEKGNIAFYSGGKLIKSYNNATVIYSDADSSAMFIETSEGKEVFLQGDVIIEL